MAEYPSSLRIGIAMGEGVAFAAFAAGMALLEDDDAVAVDRLADLGAGRVGGLRDARDLLDTLTVEAGSRERAAILIDRAITRVEDTRRRRQASHQLRSWTASTRARSEQLRGQTAEHAPRPREPEDGDSPA